MVIAPCGGASPELDRYVKAGGALLHCRRDRARRAAGRGQGRLAGTFASAKLLVNRGNGTSAFTLAQIGEYEIVVLE